MSIAPSKITPLFVLFSLAAAGHASARSAEAPAGNAGDPDGATCAVHHVAPAGAETTSVRVVDMMGMVPDSYVPGMDHQFGVVVATTAADRDRWGFSLTVLSGIDDAGTLTPGAGTTTNVAFPSGPTRTYLTHLNAPVTPFQAEFAWSFTWTAPLEGTGDVTFYICGNAADNANGRSGDWIGCGTVELTEAVVGPVDTDGDGIEDIDEGLLGTNPLDIDSDDDGLSDGDELIEMTNPLECDSDGDGLSDGLELGVFAPIADETGPPMLFGTDLAAGCYVEDLDPTTMTDPTLADSDGDDLMDVGCSDGDEDANGNGRVDTVDPDDETDPNDGADCPPVMTGMSRLQLVRDLTLPWNSPQTYFNTDPCTIAGDFRLCEEADGVYEAFDEPMTGISISGEGVFICIEFDSDLAMDGTMDNIEISKDTETAGNLIVTF